MKIAFSDFDGTLFFHDEKGIAKETKESIKKWRANGNLFVLCSGRDISSLTHEIKRQNLEYDYIICNNGGSIFDADLNVLKTFLLDKKQVKELVYSEVATKSWHILFSSANMMRTKINSPKSQLLKYFESEAYKDQQILQQITIEDALEQMNIIQISLSYESADITNKYANIIENAFDEVFSANQNLTCIDVCARGINKARGIKELLKINKHWVFEDILTIGDAENDLPMIKEFSGYSLNSATDIAKKSAKKLYNNVGEMLDEHL